MQWRKAVKSIARVTRVQACCVGQKRRFIRMARRQLSQQLSPRSRRGEKARSNKQRTPFRVVGHRFAESVSVGSSLGFGC
eukprot:6205655-Pleurochrysis_carterae.AAC.3